MTALDFEKFHPDFVAQHHDLLDDLQRQHSNALEAQRAGSLEVWNRYRSRAERAEDVAKRRKQDIDILRMRLDTIAAVVREEQAAEIARLRAALTKFTGGDDFCSPQPCDRDDTLYCNNHRTYYPVGGECPVQEARAALLPPDCRAAAIDSFTPASPRESDGTPKGCGEPEHAKDCPGYTVEYDPDGIANGQTLCAPPAAEGLDFEKILDGVASAVWAMPDKERMADFRAGLKHVSEAHRALLAAAVAKARQEEREKPVACWFIESRRGTVSVLTGESREGWEGWWYARVAGSDRFTWDPLKAIRFASKADAEKVLSASHMGQHLVITEHLFVGDKHCEYAPLVAAWTEWKEARSVYYADLQHGWSTGTPGCTERFTTADAALAALPLPGEEGNP